MTQRSPFRYFKTSPEVIRLAVMLYVRFPLSLRDVEDLMHERGIDISHETVRQWWMRFGTLFAAEIRRKRASRLRAGQQWRWHLDEVFVKINGERHYLWRAVDHEGEVLEGLVTKTRDRRAALKFLRKLMKRYGSPEQIITDKLRSYGAALKEIGHVQTGYRQAPQQPGGKLPPTLPSTGAGDAALPADAKSAAVRRRSCLRLQPLQPRSIALPPPALQAEPRRRSRRVASTRRSLSLPKWRITETSSH